MGLGVLASVTMGESAGVHMPAEVDMSAESTCPFIDGLDVGRCSIPEKVET